MYNTAAVPKVISLSYFSVRLPEAPSTRPPDESPLKPCSSFTANIARQLPQGGELSHILPRSPPQSLIEFERPGRQELLDRLGRRAVPRQHLNAFAGIINHSGASSKNPDVNTLSVYYPTPHRTHAYHLSHDSHIHNGDF